MVNFVGAGPGAADLITVRGKKLLEEADIVVYAGSLVNKELLNFIKPEASVYDSASMTLEEILGIMVDGEKAGKNTVRLHSGDPSIYGAVREQMDALDRYGIAYSVCPGVSSMSGAAASLKAEYTLPGVSQSVIITRMAGRTPVPKRESVQSLAVHRATMVIFLSAGMIKELSENLISGGYPKDTPAAIVYKATWPEEKKIITTLGKLPQVAEDNGISRMALIIVGYIFGKKYIRSSLYDPSFSHGFRRALK